MAPPRVGFGTRWTSLEPGNSVPATAQWRHARQLFDGRSHAQGERGRTRASFRAALACASASAACATCRRSCASSGRPARSMMLGAIACCASCARCCRSRRSTSASSSSTRWSRSRRRRHAGDDLGDGSRAAGSTASLWLLALEFGAGGALRRARPHRVAARFAAVRAVQQRHQPAADGARGDARPRGLRGQRAAGPARARAPAGGGPHDADGAAVRPGAGRRDDRRASPPASSSTRRGSSCCWRSRSCRRSSARRTSTRRAIRSTTRARRSGASSTTCARPARASRPRRK